jgi:hypothetical protein
MMLKSLIIALSLLAAPVAWSTSFYIPPFPQTVQNTPVIVRGRVGGSRADWGTGQDSVKRIYTYYDLQVEEVLKGDVQGSELTVRELGGEKDGVGLDVPGTARFRGGEEVVVTLSEANSDGSYDIRNLMMGKFDLRPDDSGQEVLVGPGLDPHVGDEMTSPSKVKWTLDALRKLIKAQAEGKPFTPLPAASAKVSTSPTVAPQLLPSPEASVPAESGEEGQLPWGWVAIGLFAAGILAWLFLRTRK